MRSTNKPSFVLRPHECCEYYDEELNTGIKIPSYTSNVQAELMLVEVLNMGLDEWDDWTEYEDQGISLLSVTSFTPNYSYSHNIKEAIDQASMDGYEQILNRVISRVCA